MQIQPKLQDYLAEFVYGGIDGSVTTFAVVAGAAGAGLSSNVIIILGFANLIADGFSMSVGSYLAHKSEMHRYLKMRRQEEWETQYNPEEGRQEVLQIFREKGFDGQTLEEIVRVITSDKGIWVDTMMQEELGFAKATHSPTVKAFVTFTAFFTVGFAPLLVYVWDFFSPLRFDLFVLSSILTGLSFAMIGLLKSWANERIWWRGMAETLLLGGIAAALSFIAGDLLAKLFI